MSPGFKEKLVRGYQTDSKWSQILDDLRNESEATLPYEIEDGLLYSVDRHDGRRRLCIPRSVVPEILRLAYDQVDHPGVDRMLDRLNGLAIYKVSKLVREYIAHCPECAVNRTRRHRPFGSMQPIMMPPIPFNTLTIDFIMGLPKIRDGLDQAMSVTCKFTKRTTFIPGKATWTAANWAAALLDRLRIGDWGLPRKIVSDRDPKFLSNLWKELFRRLDVQLLFSTAFHPQTDGQSERTNQQAEIALRYFLSALDTPTDWPLALPRLQEAFNSSKSASTGHTPHQLAYSIKLPISTDLVHDIEPEQSFACRIDAKEAVKIAAMSAK
ncbi:hypothetical protein DTO217A2_2938 [Paecilomyces variotii]|nr:hypothetical protein DTO217A2_2938 [Paecilomyces variotii]